MPTVSAIPVLVALAILALVEGFILALVEEPILDRVVGLIPVQVEVPIRAQEEVLMLVLAGLAIMDLTAEDSTDGTGRHRTASNPLDSPVSKTLFMLICDDSELRVHFVVHMSVDRSDLDPTSAEW